MKTFLIIFSLSISQVWASRSNPIVDFFKNAERQIEAKTQCLEVKKAFNDSLSMPPKKLLLLRYKNYQGESGKWTLVELISKYYVSFEYSLDEYTFYQNYRKYPSKNAFGQEIERLGDCNFYPEL